MTRTYNDLVTEVTEWLEGILKSGMDARRYAVAVIEESEPREDGTIHFEVSGRHSRTGNPVPASFDYYHLGWTVRFVRWDGGDATGYNAWDYLPLPPAEGFASKEEAEQYIAEEHLGPDRDGVSAVFEAVEVL